MPTQKMTRAELAERRALILGPFIGFAEEGEDELAAYLRHVGIDATMIKYAGSVEKAILAHYRIGDSGNYFDLDKAANHLATWPPIAERIAELRAQRKH
jgi:hypothetical protein